MVTALDVLGKSADPDPDLRWPDGFTKNAVRWGRAMRDVPIEGVRSPLSGSAYSPPRGAK